MKQRIFFFLRMGEGVVIANESFAMLRRRVNAKQHFWFTTYTPNDVRANQLNVIYLRCAAISCRNVIYDVEYQYFYSHRDIGAYTCTHVLVYLVCNIRRPHTKTNSPCVYAVRLPIGLPLFAEVALSTRKQTLATLFPGLSTKANEYNDVFLRIRCSVSRVWGFEAGDHRPCRTDVKANGEECGIRLLLQLRWSNQKDNSS